MRLQGHRSLSPELNAFYCSRPRLALWETQRATDLTSLRFDPPLSLYDTGLKSKKAKNTKYKIPSLTIEEIILLGWKWMISLLTVQRVFKV